MPRSPYEQTGSSPKQFIHDHGGQGVPLGRHTCKQDAVQLTVDDQGGQVDAQDAIRANRELPQQFIHDHGGQGGHLGRQTCKQDAVQLTVDDQGGQVDAQDAIRANRELPKPYGILGIYLATLIIYSQLDGILLARMTT